MVLGAYDDHLAALKATSRDHEVGTFLLQLVSPGDEAYTAFLPLPSRSPREVVPNNFTARYPGIAQELRSTCHVSMAWDNQSDQPEPEEHRFHGIWDTGATGTLISETVVERCGLKQTGLAIIRTANGNEDRVPTYVINLRLPNHVVVVGVAGSPWGASETLTSSSGWT